MITLLSYIDIEVIAVILGLIQGALIMLNKRINWIFYVLQMIALVIFSFKSKLYGDVILDSMFIGFGVYAWFSWSKTRKNVTKYDFWTFFKHCLIAGLGVLIMHRQLSLTGDPTPLKDSFTTVFGFLATWYMCLRKIETWIVWLVVDIVYIWQYATIPQPAYYLMGLNVIWAVMAICSYIIWRKNLKGSYNE